MTAANTGCCTAKWEERAPTEAATDLLRQDSYASEDSELLKRRALTSLARRVELTTSVVY